MTAGVSAQALTERLGGVWRGHYGTAACPVCQPERRHEQAALSLSGGADGKVLLYCFKSHCTFGDIAAAAGLSRGAVSIDRQAQRESEAKRAAYSAAKLKRARALWRASKPIVGTKAEIYLRARGVTCPMPDNLRFAPDIYHAPSGRWCCAMVADVEPTGGVHRTFFDKHGERLARNAKMMLGPCAGGAVRLADGAGPLVVCEGIETGLALASGLLSCPSTVWAALSTSGLKALRLPDRAGRLTIATDGDAPGREAGNQLAELATALGWRVSLLAAPDGRDWADVISARGVAS